MKKIFKIIKQNIIGFIISGIIFGGIGVYATSVITATNVGYSDNNDLEADNVQDAIDKLNIKATTKIKEAKEECPSGNVCTKTWAKVGDYVKMTPTSTSYTITTTMTGYTSNQTINPSELNLWRVININSDGTLDLVSVYVSSTDVYFMGKKGYQNYITSLNQIASQYTNSKYTIGSRYTGYNGQTGTITDTTILNFTSAPSTQDTLSSTDFIDETKGLGDMCHEKDSSLIKNAIGTLVANKVGTETSTYYWIASRRYRYDSSAVWYFTSRYVYNGGSLYIYVLYYYNDGNFYERSNGSAIRPIVTLKSGLSPTGAGTSSNPYQLS